MIKTKPLPEQSELEALFEYEPSTGHLIWRERDGRKFFNRVFAGKIAGHSDSDGYVIINVLGSLFKAHRLVWKLHHGTDPGETIDHLNRIRNDNRIENLLDASFAENMGNRTPSVRGTNATRKGNRFQAQFQHDGRTRYVGLFVTREAAMAAAALAKAAVTR